ncbi:hypothetical protein FB451DRAFT_1489504, partial [Mycena latifolia]
GTACLNCRHLKIRCDGIHPVCGNCTRVPKDNPCKFTDPTSRIPPFRPADEDNVASTSTLPHFSGDGELNGSDSPGAEFSTPTSSFSNDSVYAQSETFSDNSFVNLDIEEPPFETTLILLQHFLPHAVQFGFFLYPDRFRDAILLPQQIPFGDILRPARSVLYAVYLWGAHLSQVDSLAELEPVFLRRALECVATEICVDRAPMHALQTMQAHILLSNYLLMQRQVPAAHMHANGAATLALGYGLHKLGSAPLFDIVQDAVDASQRIRGFWAVVSLQASLTLAVDCPGSICSSLLETAWLEIDTPWPDTETQPPQFPVEGQGGEVLRRFLKDDQQPGTPSSGSAILAQASVLLHRASRLAAKWASSLRPTEFSSCMACYVWLDRRIAQFWEGLPPVHPSADDESILAHTMIAAASMKVHREFSPVDPTAQSKCMRAARTVLQALRPMMLEFEHSRSAHCGHPIVGTVGFMACTVLLDEIQRAKLERALGIEGAGGEDHNALVVELQEGIRILAACTVGSPLA